MEKATLVDKRTVRARRALTHDIGSAVAWLLEAVKSRVKSALLKFKVALALSLKLLNNLVAIHRLLCY